MISTVAQGGTEGRIVSLPVVGNYTATEFLYIFKVLLVFEMVWAPHSTTILECRKGGCVVNLVAKVALCQL